MPSSIFFLKKFFLIDGEHIGASILLSSIGFDKEEIEIIPSELLLLDTVAAVKIAFTTFLLKIN